MKKAELRLTGSGGQGVILATIILAEAGFFDKKKVVQSQSYGPEARGGMCKAEVVIDEKPITYTKVAVPNFPSPKKRFSVFPSSCAECYQISLRKL